MLQSLFDLRAELGLDIFMTDHGRQVTELSVTVWLWKLAILVDNTGPS